MKSRIICILIAIFLLIVFISGCKTAGTQNTNSKSVQTDKDISTTNSDNITTDSKSNSNYSNIESKTEKVLSEHLSTSNNTIVSSQKDNQSSQEKAGNSSSKFEFPKSDDSRELEIDYFN